MEKDERFKHIASDPKFRRIPRQERKVKIDKRFQSMFKDAKFKVKSSVDKRGRPESFASSENFRRFYDLSSSADSSSSAESEESQEEEEEEVEKKLKIKEQIRTKQKVSNKKQHKSQDFESSSDEEEEKKVTSNLGKTTKSRKESDKPQKIIINSKQESSKTKGKGAKKGNKLTSRKELSDENNTASDEEISTEEEDSVLDVKTEEGTVVSATVREKLRDLSVDYARGGGRLHSEEESSSDEESEDSGQESVEEVEHAWGELDKDADRTEESTSRLAVCNMDWQRVRAEDLMVLLSSFLPPTGAITSVSVYPSDFGLKCLKEEEKQGPKELAEQKPLLDGDDGSEQLDVERLRSYELRRLRYYYAVVCCDSAATAGHLYSECDGIEYESSAARLDLRFVPDDTTFDHEPREVCSSLPEAGKYQPRYYSSGALTQAKFELTWDETDPRRVELSQRLWASKDKELPEDELRGVLASSSSEDEQEGSGARYRALLDGDKGEDKVEEVEVSWGLELQAKADKKAEQSKREAAGLAEPTPFEELMQRKRDKSRQKKMERLKKHEQASGNVDGEQAAFSDDELPPELQDVQAELTAERGNKSKRKGKKKKGRVEQEEQDPQQRAELELLLLDDGDQESRHFNLGSRQPAKDKAKDDDFEVDVADPRFGALYTSHHFNLDPADPHFKASRSTQALVAEKLRRRTQEHAEVSSEKAVKAKRPRDAELSQLVRNVKRKTEMSMASRGKRH